MSDDLSGDMLAPSWPNLVISGNYPALYHNFWESLWSIEVIFLMDVYFVVSTLFLTTRQHLGERARCSELY